MLYFPKEVKECFFLALEEKVFSCIFTSMAACTWSNDPFEKSLCLTSIIGVDRSSVLCDDAPLAAYYASVTRTKNNLLSFFVDDRPSEVATETSNSIGISS